MRQRSAMRDGAAAMDRFLADVERRAFRIARMALRDDEDALDTVQDAMLQLARRYGRRPETEWRALFYRILQNRIRDLQRRRQVRNRFLAWLPGPAHPDADAADPIDRVQDPAAADGPRQLESEQILEALGRALDGLPVRQREAFVLRCLEGMDVAETAQSMHCSEGSVKTHYSRAVHSLRVTLGDRW